MALRALVAAGLTAASGAHAADPPDPTHYVTVRDRLMCRTQQELRDGLKAIETKDSFLMSTLGTCHFSIDGVPAILLQDNISRIKIRLMADGQRADMWTVPETIRRAPTPKPE